jgi:two-component system nitrogen regulation sensor histidine kinase GlnL
MTRAARTTSSPVDPTAAAAADDASPVPWADVLASIEDGVVVLDRAGRVTSVNPAAEEMLGGIPTAESEREAAALFGPRRGNAWIGDLVRRTLTEGVARRRGEGVLGTQGREMPIAVACAPIQDPDGGLRGAVLVLHDLTLQRTLEAATRRADRLAALGTVTVGLAHEIRNPLGGIKGAAQLLRGALADPGLVRATDVIVNEVDRLDGLIEQLREFSRPPQLQLEAVNIHRILNDVLALQRQAPVWGSVTLRTEFDPSLPAVRGDRAQLTQVFLNLIKNSLEALGGRGELAVVTQIDSRFHVRRGATRGRLLAVAIEDTGAGVPEVDQPHLFAPFFTTKPRGTGLGLAVCQRIITEHGGTIGYEPRRGGGARFRVTLPVSEEEVGA